MDIPLTTNKVPITNIYRLPAHDRLILDNILDDYVEKDFIQQSDSAYSSPCFLRPKSDSKYNLIVDYTALNHILTPLNEYFPDIKEVFPEFVHARYFTKLDLKQGFYQIQIFNSDRHKTAFATHRGKYEFKRLPFVLKNSPKFLQKILKNY